MSVSTPTTASVATLTGLGTNVATALGVNVGSAGAVVLFNGAGGTPSSITLTNGTGLPPAGVTGTAAILGANTFTTLQTITQANANTGILASTGYSLTGSNATNMLNLTGTWNTSGNPTALFVNILNTASGSTTKFFDFQASSVSQASLDKGGYLGALGMGNSQGFECFASQANALARTISGRNAAYSSNTGGGVGGILWASDYQLRWTSVAGSGGSDAASSGSLDTTISRAAVATVGFNGGIRLAAATTARPHMNLASGVAPTSPANGDFWFDGTDLKMRAGGVTYTFTKT